MKNNRTAVLGFSAGVVLLIVAYIPAIRWMIDRWTAEGSYYSHGFLIPFISLYFVWKKRDVLKTLKIEGRSGGLFIAAGGLFVNLACAALRVYFISALSLIMVLYGLVLFFFGRKIVRELVFPIFLLLAMIPLPLVVIGTLTVKLKLFVTQACVLFLNNIGFPSVQDGSIIKMPNSLIMVEAPCSGLRSLIALLTLGIIFTYTSNLPKFRKIILFLSAVPIAVISNLARITLLAIANDLYGEKAAMGFFHDFCGFMVFVLAFLCFLAVSKALEGRRGETA